MILDYTVEHPVSNYPFTQKFSGHLGEEVEGDLFLGDVRIYLLSLTQVIIYNF